MSHPPRFTLLKYLFFVSRSDNIWYECVRGCPGLWFSRLPGRGLPERSLVLAIQEHDSMLPGHPPLACDAVPGSRCSDLLHGASLSQYWQVFILSNAECKSSYTVSMQHLKIPFYLRSEDKIKMKILLCRYKCKMLFICKVLLIVVGAGPSRAQMSPTAAEDDILLTPGPALTTTNRN